MILQRPKASLQTSGAPNDTFILNTLKTLFRLSKSTLRSLEIHSKWSYKICICSLILGEFEFFERTRASVFFSSKFQVPLIITVTNYENENFTDSSLHHIYELKKKKNLKKNLGFLFL